MKTKSLAAASCAVLGAGMAFAGLSVGAPNDKKVEPSPARAGGGSTYKGKFTQSGPGTKVVIKARTEGGEVRRLKSLKYSDLPASCSVTGFQRTSGFFPTNARVNADTRRFKAAKNFYNPDTDVTSKFKWKGRFSSNFERVRGKFSAVLVYGPDTTFPPPETCTTAPSPYSAKR